MSHRVFIAFVPFLALSGCVADEDGERVEAEVADAEPDADAQPGADAEAVGELKAEPGVAGAVVPPASLLVSSAAKWQYVVQPGDHPWVSGLCRSPAPGWTEPGFYVDESWSEGLAELGYGDAEGDDLTEINAGPSSDDKCITQYFRHEFYAFDTSRLESLVLRLLADDGAVVYLNGNEIARHNLPYGNIYPHTPAKSAVSGSAEDKFLEFTGIDAGQLEEYVDDASVNVLAVEVHQYSKKDSDLSFNAELVGVLDPNAEDVKTFSFASREATIDESRPTYTLGGDSTCKADGASGDDNADKAKEQICLSQWDLAAHDLYYQQIPANSTVVAAHVVAKVVNTSPSSYQVFRVEGPWLESKISWGDPDGNMSGEWYDAQFSAWDVEEYPVSSVNALSTGTRIIPLPAALVQDWIDDPSSNNGVAILNFAHVNGIDFSASNEGLKLMVTVKEGETIPG